MKLLRLHAKNLFSLKDVTLDLNNRGLLLVTGHSIDEGGANASGKSSLSNKAILWTLFGQTAGGEKADAVVNRFRGEGEETFGEIEFESTSGGRFRLHRSRGPSRLLLYDLDADKNISSTTEKDTQVIVNKILGRNRETFLQTDFFGQGKSASFLDLTPKAQVELLENILPFERLNELHDKARHYHGLVKQVVQRYVDRVTETQGQLQECQRQERVLSTSVDKWEQDHIVS
ncbi:MAG TPA: AAA family ATPase, partial [Candidatus Hodarchaeales archaeon]|nr:AAA family ATPase [Candidatus Hodarchaeales archaeon]